MRNLIKSLLERTPFMLVNRTRRRGLHLFDDLRELLPNSSDLTFFDVGANEGQTALQLHRAFPKAQIHSFEPGRNTFQLLTSNVGNVPQINGHNFALGSEDGTAPLYLHGWSQGNSLVPELAGTPSGTENVDVTTIDAFCAENGIRGIDLLKTDTEGFDLDVIAGASNLLRSGRVHLIYSEIGVRRRDRRHTPLSALLGLLEPLNYHLFSLYDPPLREVDPANEFFNALFVPDQFDYRTRERQAYPMGAIPGSPRE